jgi:hypothetical protein
MIKRYKEKKNRVFYFFLWFSGLVIISATIFLLHIKLNTATPAHESNVSSKHAAMHTETKSLVSNQPKVEVKPISSVQRSNFAYVTLISGIDSSFKYRGFFYNTLLMKKALSDLGSTADFIVLLGFDEANTLFFEEDAMLFRRHNITMYMLPRFVHDSHGLSFAEMALLKITPWSFTQYDRVQFLDGDVMPTKNMDCFFKLSQNTFTVGAASPLNSGWFLAVPNHGEFIQLRKLALWRLGRDWNKETGWADRLPANNPLFYRGGDKACTLWDFNGADMDQGLLCHYYVLNNGKALLIDTDTRTTRFFKRGLLNEPDVGGNVNDDLSCCSGQLPTSFFLHFTGQSKPWVKTEKKAKSKSSIQDMWMKKLHELNLTINDCVLLGDCKSPLGYWNRDFPKGGFQTLPETDIKDYIVM